MTYERRRLEGRGRRGKIYFRPISAARYAFAHKMAEGYLSASVDGRLIELLWRQADRRLLPLGIRPAASPVREYFPGRTGCLQRRATSPRAADRRAPPGRQHGLTGHRGGTAYRPAGRPGGKRQVLDKDYWLMRDFRKRPAGGERGLRGLGRRRPRKGWDGAGGRTPDRHGPPNRPA